MLRDLVIRDWMLHRRALIPIFAILAAFQVYFVLRAGTTRGWFVFSCFYAAFLTIVPFTREDRFGSTGWTCTLPVTRAQIVRARFVEAWLLVLGWLAASVSIAAITPGSTISLARIAAPATAFVAVAVIVIVLSLLLPFTIRFGILGVILFLVVMQVLGAVVLLVVTLRGAGGSRGGDPIRSTIEGVRSGLAAAHDALTTVPFHLVVAVLLAALHWAAYRSAVALFRRKEL